MNQSDHISQLNKEGYSILPNVYSETEVARICELINLKELSSDSVLKSKDLFAIRQLLNEIPQLLELILNPAIKSLVQELQTDGEPFLSKAIYFDKPEDSNCFVSYHQDLIINVSERKELAGFKNWTNKKGQIGVQPPTDYLDRTTTIRIHLDDTDATNGALRIIPKSHRHGVIRLGDKTDTAKELVCAVKRGGVMLMKPLTLHASSRSTGKRNRRVIHLEICDKELPQPLKWKEKQTIVNAAQSLNG